MLPDNPAVITAIIATGAALSLAIGKRLLVQAVLLTVVGILVTGKRYKWFNILYRTLPRDLKALKRFMLINATIWFWEKNSNTVAKQFSKVAKLKPDKTLFLFEDQKWTFREVDELSNQIAHYFKNLGYQRNDTIALIMEGKPEYVCIWLGLSKIGVVTALINYNLRQGPLIHSIRASSCKGVIFGSEFFPVVLEISDELKDLALYQYSEANMNQIPSEKICIDLNREISHCPKTTLPDIQLGKIRDKLLYIYTSGTTGLPKAAVVTNSRYIFMVVGTHFMLDIQEEDILYDSLPLYHTAGGIVGTGQGLLMGGTVVIRKKFSASNFWKDCVTYNCTVAQYIGEICRYLLSVGEKPQEKQHKVKLMFGNGLRPQIWPQFVKRFGISQIGEFYGATEGNSNLVNIDNTVGAVGFVPRYASFVYPVALIKVDKDTGEPVRDKEGLCIRCEPGEPGLFVGIIDPKKAINSFHGYADKSASEKKIIKDIFRKGEQAFNTGDILVMDEYGYYYFRDRTGDTFRWRGENVATSEVEAVISNVVGLKDAVVYGVEIPNVEGRAGMAAIVDEENTLNLEKLMDGLKKQLPVYARPMFLRVMPRLPMTGTYKLKKNDLQAEGYNPEIVQDPLFFFKNGTFVPLTEELYMDIVSGKERL